MGNGCAIAVIDVEHIFPVEIRGPESPDEFRRLKLNDAAGHDGARTRFGIAHQQFQIISIKDGIVIDRQHVIALMLEGFADGGVSAAGPPQRSIAADSDHVRLLAEKLTGAIGGAIITDDENLARIGQRAEGIHEPPRHFEAVEDGHDRRYQGPLTAHALGFSTRFLTRA